MPMTSASQMLKKLLDPTVPEAVEERYAEFRPTIPMGRALLCLDCDSIFEATGHQTCPSCCSAAAWVIGRALSRDAAPAATMH